MAEAEFLLASNWVLLPEGVQEFYDELQQHPDGAKAKAGYDVVASSIKLKCLISDEAAVMAACQAALDKLVRRELANGWESGKKIAKSWVRAKASEQYKEASLLVFSPPEILRASSRAAWILPGELADKNIFLAHLVPDEAMTNLQQRTGCTLRADTDGRVMYIGADSSESIARAQEKLNAVVEHLARFPQSDTRCETFIYAEDQQDGKATFSYLEHGPRAHLKTFFLDRAEYNVEPGRNEYTLLFQEGVAVSLWDGDRKKPIPRPGDNVRAASEGQAESFSAFPAGWAYKAKDRRSDDPALPSGQGQMVAAWVAHLPQPGQMLPHGEGSQSGGSTQLQTGSYDPSQPRQLMPVNPLPAAAPAIMHATMNQQGRRKGRFNNNHKAPQPIAPAPKPVKTEAPIVSPMLVHAISQKLASMVTGLEMFTGHLAIHVNFGRLYLKEINKNLVWHEDSKQRGQVKPLQELKNTLDSGYTSPKDVDFTKILTAKGADANYISLMTDGSGKRIWSGYQRRTVYEIVCSAVTKTGDNFIFVIEVNGNDFSYRIRDYDDEACSLFVHCPKRSWDFKITLSKTPRLGQDFEAFAKDLVNNMRVVPQTSGVPNLELVLKKAYQVVICITRTVNIASYQRNEAPSDPSLLHIREVHDMSTDATESNDEVSITLSPYPAATELGQLPKWYEVSMQSKIINIALNKNRDLAFGDKVGWSADQLLKGKGFDLLVRSAAQMVRKIDGVGFGGDNHQDTGIHPGPDVKGSVW
ncbi:hypothetical protein Hte_005239 [Hypoxylon texense]